MNDKNHGWLKIVKYLSYIVPSNLGSKILANIWTTKQFPLYIGGILYVLLNGFNFMVFKGKSYIDSS